MSTVRRACYRSIRRSQEDLRATHQFKETVTIDSGVSEHIAGNSALFKESNEFSPFWIDLEDGPNVEANEKDFVPFSKTVGRILLLSEKHCLPELSMNFL